MAEQKLNLLQLAATRMAEFRTRPPQIVWGNASYSRFLTTGLYHIPDHVLGDAFAPDPPRSAHSPEDPAFRDASSLYPFIQRLLRPLRDRYGSDMATLAH